LLLSAENEQVTSYDMERRCLDRNFSDTYAPTFRNNFAQMKIETPKSTGKVFEEKNGFVTVWERVAPTLESYRAYFTEEREPSETSEQ